MISSARPQELSRPTRPFIDDPREEDTAFKGDDRPLENGTTTDTKGSAPSPKSSKLHRLKDKAKDKAKNVFKAHSDATSDGDDAYKDDLQQDPVFNSQLLNEKLKQDEVSSPVPVSGILKKVGFTLAHPKKAIKDKATRTTAGKLSKPHRPFLSQDADLEFLQAHEDLAKAASERSSQDFSSDTDGEGSAYHLHRDRIERLQAERTSLKIAWTTSRHVSRARVTPKRQWPYPEFGLYVNKDENGKRHIADVLPWLGQYLVWYTQDFAAQYVEPSGPTPFDVDTLRRHVERIAVASAPWQAWFMQLRSVYRWENPRITGKWLALFLVLWYYDHVVNFIHAYIFYVVCRNRYYPTSVESLRAAQHRSQDQRQRGYQISELMDKHGNDDWLQPLAQDLGPYVQLQLNDVANLLETLQHFYHWTAPRKTAASLFFVFACLLVSLFADMAFCVKIFWFVSGLTFFCCWPVASLYPRYRLLVSPTKWVFWGVPSDAEWSFMYLRREAQVKRAELIKRKVEDRFTNADGSLEPQNVNGRYKSIPVLVGEDENHHSIGVENEDSSSENESYYSADSADSVCDGETFLTFSCTYKGFPGRFTVSSSSIGFVPRFKQGDGWDRSFLCLAEMRKHHGSKVKQLPVSSSTEILELIFTDGDSLCLKGMKGRDDAFNSVIAFSGIQWQNLQPDI